MFPEPKQQPLLQPLARRGRENCLILRGPPWPFPLRLGVR